MFSHFASSAADSPKQEVDYKLIRDGVRACRQTPMVQEQEQSLAHLLQRHAGIPAKASCSILARALLTASRLGLGVDCSQADSTGLSQQQPMNAEVLTRALCSAVCPVCGLSLL